MNARMGTTAPGEPAAIPARAPAGSGRKGTGRIIAPKPKYPPRGQRRPHTWQTRLAFLLAIHGRQKLKGGRQASNRTLQARRQALYGVFRLLREADFKLQDPANLDARHVAFVLGEWQRRRRLHDVGEPGGLAPATVAGLVSVLRAFCGWIGQPQLMDCIHAHPPGLTARSRVAARDLTWEGHGLDTLAVMEHAWAIEPWVCVALLLQFTFGLRKREAVMFRLDAACWPGESVVAINIARPGSSGLRGKASAGSKGGRPRLVMIRAPWENAVLEFARCFVHGESGQHGHLGARGRGLIQNLRTYRRVLEKLGVTRKA
ncbi:integrase domain-containing protein [Azohydromonas australica]|uniref:integrase domain-containing protein n=1 Tax=Azohydromonas australica TaxID=364039 RepID=UPI0012EB4E75|nr:integrase domain-containing protein [Azohydromonas australica]